MVRRIVARERESIVCIQAFSRLISQRQCYTLALSNIALIQGTVRGWLVRKQRNSKDPSSLPDPDPSLSINDKLEQKILALSMELMSIGEESSPEFQDAADRLNFMQEELRERRTIESLSPHRRKNWNSNDSSMRNKDEDEPLEKEEERSSILSPCQNGGDDSSPFTSTDNLSQESFNPPIPKPLAGSLKGDNNSHPSTNRIPPQEQQHRNLGILNFRRLRGKDVDGGHGSSGGATAVPKNQTMPNHLLTDSEDSTSQAHQKEGQPQPHAAKPSTFENEMLSKARMSMARIRKTFGATTTAPLSTRNEAKTATKDDDNSTAAASPPSQSGPKAHAGKVIRSDTNDQHGGRVITNQKLTEIKPEKDILAEESSELMLTPSSSGSEKKSTHSFKSSDGRRKSGRPSGTGRKIKKEKKLTPEEKMKNLSTDFINLSHRMKGMPKFSPEWTLSKMEMKLITEELEFLYAESMNRKGAVSAVPQVG